MLMPGLSSIRIPVKVRLYISMGCSMAVLHTVLKQMVQTNIGEPWLLLRMMASEIFIGATIGVLSNVYFWALQFMANMIATGIGQSGAPVGAITESEPQAILATIVNFGALYLFFASDLHLDVLHSLLNSYAVIPLDGAFRTDAALTDFADGLSAAFLATLRLAAPFIVFAVMVNFSIGLINKLTPAIPVYFVSMPLVVGAGLLVFYFMLPEILRSFLTEITGELASLQ